ncbi:MAG: class I SAM-dependent methyltransferase [Nitrospirae bacterium]|nr:class I SAM-dependent methyltransferase [Nitrospirota bacterium]
MKQFIRTKIQQLIQKLKIDIAKHLEKMAYPPDFSEQNIRTCNAVKPYTTTNPERINALIDAVRFVVLNKIDGAMVECGVWRGGSIMAIALTLKEMGIEDREIYLYDTFAGMSAPSDADYSIHGYDAREKFSKTKISGDASNWCMSTLEEVKQNVFSTGYPKEKFHFIKGKVEDTIPGDIPKEIALLRLDTDWYESTKHELTHLFPLLKPKGVLIIDDYGHWKGAKKAVDEYISENAFCILLNRIDYTGRIAIKTQ